MSNLNLQDMRVAEIAKIIKDDWKKPYFGAVPYIEAMFSFVKDGDRYGFANAEEICTYFLVNAQTWRGPVAREVKAELKRRFNIK
jgi:hypothetical protein